MLRKSSSSSAGGGSGTKHIQQLPRHHSKPHPESLSPGSAKTWATMGRPTRNPSPLSSMWLSSRLMGAPGVDPDYVMQLVNDVRWFADVLISLKDAFQQQGGFRKNRDVKVCYKRSTKTQSYTWKRQTYLQLLLLFTLSLISEAKSTFSLIFCLKGFPFSLSLFSFLMWFLR